MKNIANVGFYNYISTDYYYFYTTAKLSNKFIENYSKNVSNATKSWGKAAGRGSSGSGGGFSDGGGFSGRRRPWRRTEEHSKNKFRMIMHRNFNITLVVNIIK